MTSTPDTTLAAASPTVSPWPSPQPIATAPKDRDSTILGFRQGWEMWRPISYESFGEEWFDASSNDELPDQPTVWLPMPQLSEVVIATTAFARGYPPGTTSTPLFRADVASSAPAADETAALLEEYAKATGGLPLPSPLCGYVEGEFRLWGDRDSVATLQTALAAQRREPELKGLLDTMRGNWSDAERAAGEAEARLRGAVPATTVRRVLALLPVLPVLSEHSSVEITDDGIVRFTWTRGEAQIVCTIIATDTAIDVIRPNEPPAGWSIPVPLLEADAGADIPVIRAALEDPTVVGIAGLNTLALLSMLHATFAAGLPHQDDPSATGTAGQSDQADGEGPQRQDEDGPDSPR